MSGLLSARSTPAAQMAPSSPLSLQSDTAGLHISWSGGVSEGAYGSLRRAPSIAGWPLIQIGDLQLPGRLVAVQLPGEAAAAPQIGQVESQTWRGDLIAATPIIPQDSAGQLRPALAAQASAAPPAAPLIVLREGRLRGVHIAVLAISPIFSSNGEARAASSFTAMIPGATLFASSYQALNQATSRFIDGASAPSNPAAQQASFSIQVSEGGIQRISGAALASAGMNLSALTPARLHLYHGANEIALEERIGGDGRLDTGDELRFYAATPGDRWNSTDSYWLTIESSNGLRMATRTLPSGSGSASASARQIGIWSSPALYDSLLPGPDGDHWFAADLKTGPQQAPMTLTLALTPTLPLASGTTTLTVTGSAYTADAHLLQVKLGSDTQQASWSGTADWQHRLSFSTSGASAQLILQPGTVADGIEPDSIAWERPVTLDFSGGGASFIGRAGLWRYQLANVPAARALYDISTPSAPQIVPLPSGSSPSFQDGTAVHRYILASAATLQTPAVSAHAAVDLQTPRSADVVYIAPAQWLSALAPLVARRQAQGHTVATIDVQAIYDSWSYGQISPDAIRAFLRYAAASWITAPIAVTLVGDGTSDPRNYTARDNQTFIPPYLAMVDPWLGETACDTCYAQLDGDDPLADELPDLALGRLPAKSADEVQALVSKIIGYEQASGGMDWRSRAVFVADNYREADGSADGAGDFAAFADQIAAQQPDGVEIQRLYYDPSPSYDGTPWREPHADLAHERTLALLGAGAGLAVYVGHSHQWQWAVTDTSADPSYLLGLYDPDGLSNADSLPILLEMTCLTSAFQTPAYSGTTIDERLLLASGGAAAIWGPTGLGVAHGHDLLARGFSTALWQAPSMSATVGSLTTAGYLELFTDGTCCQDTLRTYLLLGDPLTPARVAPASRAYMPLIRR